MPFEIPEEIINLAPMVQRVEDAIFPSYLDETSRNDGPAILDQMGQYVVEEFDQDLASRSEWEENATAFHKLFTGYMPEKTEPWENCSNICLPLLTTAVLQFHARAYEALFPPREVVKVYPVEESDIPRAERVSKFMDYQVLYKMPNYGEGMDKSLMQLPIMGDIHRKTFFDPGISQNVSQYVSSMDVVVNYGVQDIESAKRITHILYLTVNEIRKRVRKEIFLEEAWDLGPGEKTNQSPLRDQVDDAQGTQEAGLDHDKTRMFLEQQRDWDLDGDGIAEPYVVTTDYETGLVVRITSRTHQGKVVEYWTHYVFFPNPEGYYGLGLGILIRHLNEAANGIINEVIDAGSLANMQGGFVNTRSGIKGGALDFQRGQYKSVNANTDDLRKAIFSFEFKGPNATLYQVLGLLFNQVERVSSISESMSGKMPSSDTTTNATLAVIEQGSKVISSIYKRIRQSLKKEFDKIYRLNSLFLDEELYFHFLWLNNLPDMQQQQEPIGKADFRDDDNVQPVSDPSIISKSEKVAKAQLVVQDVRTNPMTANNPEANYKATERLYKALDIENIGEILKPPPPPPDLSPEEENAGFFTEQPANVLPQQDHAWHLTMHKDFEDTDTLFAELTPAGVKLLQQHTQATIAALYLAAKQNESNRVKAAVTGQGPAPPPAQIP